MSSLLDLDSATAALISQLVLEDIDDIRRSSKGKGSEYSPLSNEECAFQAFADEVHQAVRYVQDLELARSVDHALELDQPVLAVLSVVEEGTRDDRLYAEALQNERPLPAQSEVQRLMEDPEFDPGHGRLLLNRLMVLSRRDGRDTVTDAAPSSSSQIVDVQRNDSLELAQRPDHWQMSRQVQCVICGERLRSSASFTATCGHFYCHECIANLARSCIGDESLYPLQCCRQPLPMEGPEGLFAQLERRLRCSLREKVTEFATPSANRMYCPRPTCSVFLGSNANRTADVRCASCGTDVCVSCKQTAHPGERCGENEALEQVKALARERHWQTCPGCARIFDLQQGCFHMTCLCRTQFCYVCAALWKNCRCPQWEETQLLNTAERRVENEMGARARVVAPEIFQRRVEERVERLRYDHDCADGHRWRRRDGRARCEQCHKMLPEYLLLCRSCGIAACVRCARNRL
ncbi:hypothetical protein GGX14DRAFT_355237 [Mycena pura]|uniref:RBR-type E3 ubiquitin transferase n=1 Tax=Mycena pura TaxID=153505 RepID=A0AAD6VR58_9AGAR|nr:hypothetical protein GGX14DRAFT_355237 [Mycena pura]